MIRWTQEVGGVEVLMIQGTELTGRAKSIFDFREERNVI